MTLLLGFIVIFLGVYLLSPSTLFAIALTAADISRGDPHGIVHNKPTAYRHSLMETRASMNGLDDPRSISTPRSARFGAGHSTHDLEHGLKHGRTGSQSDDDDAAIRLTGRGDSDDEIDELDELPRANGKHHPLRSPDATSRRSRPDLSLNGKPVSPYRPLV